MIRAPIIRVLIPHELVWHSSAVPLSLVKVIPNAAAKFVPKKCEVPACRARPSRIMASIVNVRSAPANRSLGVFSPGTVAMAAVCTARSW